MYFECIKEKYGYSYYQDDAGFFTYEIVNNVMIIHEFYIKPEFRTSIKIQKIFVNKMLEIAGHLKCQKVGLSVYLKAKNGLQESTMHFMIRNHCKIVSTTPTHIWVERTL